MFSYVSVRQSFVHRVPMWKLPMMRLTSLYPPKPQPQASDIWWPSLETCSKPLHLRTALEWHLVVPLKHMGFVSRWYASYWNTFFLLLMTVHWNIMEKNEKSTTYILILYVTTEMLRYVVINMNIRQKNSTFFGFHIGQHLLTNHAIMINQTILIMKQECIPVAVCWGVSAREGGGIPACTEANPPLWTEWQTGLKTLPCRNFVVNGNNPPPFNYLFNIGQSNTILHKMRSHLFNTFGLDLDYNI